MKFSQKSLPYKVFKTIGKNKLIAPGEKIVVAVSGGADSVCLFDVLFKLKNRLNIDLAVCHYNHRLRGEDSYNDFAFVKKIAKDYGTDFFGGEAKRDNLFKNEEEARFARYQFFEKILREGRGDKMAVAHNLNDQIETFFLRLLRGTGLSGLKSIPYRREKFIRPLLDISRIEIEDYLQKEGLSFRVDQTNFDLSFTRNYFRHKVIPMLQKINPNLEETLAGTIASLNEDDELIEKLSEEAFKNILESEEKNKIILSRKKWLLLPSALRSGTIRYAISQLSSLLDITAKQLEEVKNILEKGEGKKFRPLPHSLRVHLVSGKIVVLVEK